MWSKIGASNTVLSWINYGIPWTFCADPEPLSIAEPSFSPDCDAEIERMMDLGAFEELPEEEFDSAIISLSLIHI